MRIAPKGIASDPIKLPGSPFWTVFKRFGRDEGIAMITNIIGTAIASFFTSSPLFISISGPIFEKIGFFPGHFKDAWTVYKTTPETNRKKLSFYFWKAVRGGSVSLAEDVVIHDPVYIFLMYVGITISPAIPVWILAALSFIVAVVVVSFIEVGVTELRYAFFKKRLVRKGFETENYFESRFHISSDMDPEEVISNLSRQFNLNSWGSLEYSDIYFEHKISNYSGRTAKLRLRRRTPYEISQANVYEVVERDGFLQTVQVVFTRASELCEHLDQCRYFPLKKDKLYFFLDQEMPCRIRDVECDQIKNHLERLRNRDEPIKKVNFKRTLAQNSELLVSVDEARGGKHFYLLELKSYDTKILQTAMRYVMMEFPVVQTTYGKHELTKEKI